MARWHILQPTGHNHETKIRKSLEPRELQRASRSSPIHKNNTTLLLWSNLPNESLKHQSNQIQEDWRRWVLHRFQVRLHKAKLGCNLWSIWLILYFKIYGCGLEVKSEPTARYPIKIFIEMYPLHFTTYIIHKDIYSVK